MRDDIERKQFAKQRSKHQPEMELILELAARFLGNLPTNRKEIGVAIVVFDVDQGLDVKVACTQPRPVLLAVLKALIAQMEEAPEYAGDKFDPGAALEARVKAGRAGRK